MLPEDYAKTLPEGYLKTLESKIKELRDKNEAQVAALSLWFASARKANLCSKHCGEDMQFEDGKRTKENDGKRTKENKKPHKWIHYRKLDSFHCSCGRFIKGEQIDKAASDYELVYACSLSRECWEAWCDFSGIENKEYPKAASEKTNAPYFDARRALYTSIEKQPAKVTPTENFEQAIKDAYTLPDTTAILNTYALAQRAESAQQRAELLHYDGSGNFILQVDDQEVPFELVLVIWRSEIIKRKLEWEKKTRLTLYCQGDYVDD